jgi:DNA polymerase I-like protein with 3'-5' exonuclease and polymerase domains
LESLGFTKYFVRWELVGCDARDAVMDLVTLDFETYYSKEFSLSKLTTEKYIRDDRFQTIGVATKINDREVQWFPNQSNKIEDHFAGIDWNKAILVAHNAMFDAAILSWRYGVKPKIIADTMSMSRAIDGVTAKHSLKACSERHGIGVKGTEILNALGKHLQDFTSLELKRYAQYCRNDVELTFKLFCIYAKHFNAEELEVVSTTMKMFTEPVLELDIPLLEQHLDSVVSAKEELMRAAKSNSEMLQSNPKFAECLKTLRVDPPMKVSPRTNKKTFAFSKSDKAMTDLLEHPNPAVQTLVAARIGVKSTLEETRTQRLLGIAKRAGVLPVPLRYYAAHTGRWGGSDKLNMQNLPSRGSNTIKQSIIAPDGYMLIDADSSQIEARTLAWLAGQNDLVEAFANDKDVYKIMASQIYNKPEDKITKNERFVGKSVILGSGYGMGAERFKNQLAGFDVDIHIDQARAIINIYRETYSYIPALWREANRCLDALQRGQSCNLGKHRKAIHLGNGGFYLPNGMLLTYPELEIDSDDNYSYASRNSKTKIYGGKVIENVCQALARCIISWQMVQIAKKYKIALTVHDSLVCVVREEEVQEAQEFIEGVMRTSPKWARGLPLDCESGVGKNYGECG